MDCNNLNHSPNNNDTSNGLDEVKSETAYSRAIGMMAVLEMHSLTYSNVCCGMDIPTNHVKSF
jgi:hypothetical protein